MSLGLVALVKMAVMTKQTKLFICPVDLFPLIRRATLEVSGARKVVDIDVDQMGPEESCEVFRTAGRTGDVAFIRALGEVGPIEAMIYVWHLSGGQDGTGRGDLLNDDGTNGDRTTDGFVVLLCVTPEAYRRIDRNTLRRVYPPKDAYHFLTEDHRSWEIFQKPE